MRPKYGVEVQKTSAATTWYVGSVLDVSESTVRVAFESKVWPDQDFPLNQVRVAHDPAGDPDPDSEAWEPAEGDDVEVFSSLTEVSPSGWTRGKITRIKASAFYFVNCAGKIGSSDDMIVEKKALRRPSASTGFLTDGIKRITLKVDDKLREWIKTPDGIGCLEKVAERTQLLAATCMVADRGRSTHVLLIGSERHTELAERLLVGIHFDNQLRIEQYQQLKMSYLSQLEEYKRQWGSWHKEVFEVDMTFVGRIIGTKGSNIAKLREEFDVEIELADNMHTGKTTVTASGESEENVLKARESMEYRVIEVQVDPEQVGWMIGKAHKHLQEIQSKTDLCYARYNDKTQSIELCGLRTQVEDAKLMLSVHRDYLAKYNEIDVERKILDEKFREMENKGKKGNGKGKGKYEDDHDVREGKKGGGKSKGKYDDDNEPREGKKGGGKSKGKYDDDYEPREGKKGGGNSKGKHEDDWEGKEGKKGGGKSKGKYDDNDFSEGAGKKGWGKNRWTNAYDSDSDGNAAPPLRGRNRDKGKDKGDNAKWANFGKGDWPWPQQGENEKQNNSDRSKGKGSKSGKGKEESKRRGK